MPNITPEQRDERFEGVSEIAQSLYSSPESGFQLRQIFTKNNLLENLYSPYVTVVGDAILGFHQEAELPKLLKEQLSLSDDAALRLNADLLNFLAPLHDATSATAEQPVSTLTSDITETEAALKRLSTVRTMARDMHDLESQAPHEPNTHQSTQATTLNRDQANSPAATPTQQPQWESTT